MIRWELFALVILRIYCIFRCNLILFAKLFLNSQNKFKFQLSEIIWIFLNKKLIFKFMCQIFKTTKIFNEQLLNLYDINLQKFNGFSKFKPARNPHQSNHEKIILPYLKIFCNFNKIKRHIHAKYSPKCINKMARPHSNKFGRI